LAQGINARIEKVGPGEKKKRKWEESLKGRQRFCLEKSWRKKGKKKNGSKRNLGGANGGKATQGGSGAAGKDV